MITKVKYSYNLNGKLESGTAEVDHEFDSAEELKKMMVKHWFNLDYINKINSVEITPNEVSSYSITLEIVEDDNKL